MIASGAVTAYALIGRDDGKAGQQTWYHGYELEGPAFHYSAPATTRGHSHPDQATAILAAANVIDQRLQDVIRAADYGNVSKQSAKRARKLLQEKRDLIGKTAAVRQPIGDASPLSFDPKARKPTTAIAVRSTALVTVEAAASPAKLRKHASDFEKAWVILGRNFLALGETIIAAQKDGVSVDDLIAETGLTAARSTAYAAAKATRLWRVFEPFASPARVVLDCESQFRDFPADLQLEGREARKIVNLIERNIEPNKRGQRRPTREQLKPILAGTIGPRGIGPEKRPPAGHKTNQAESRPSDLPGQAKLFAQEPSADPPRRTATADPPMQAPPTATPAAMPRQAPLDMYAEGEERIERDLRDATMIVAFDKKQRRNTLADITGWAHWLEILRNPAPSDGSDPGYWNGQPNPHARQLHGLTAIVRLLAAWKQPGPPGVEGTNSSPRSDLANLLYQLAAQIKAADSIAAGRPTRPRRAK